MTEFTFSKDYRQAFRAALEQNNTYMMNRLFEDLCAECGMPDVKGDAEQVSAAKAIAERLNAIGKGTTGRKV